VRVIVEQLAGETEVLGETLPQRHFVHHKSNLTKLGIEPGPPRWEASDLPLELWRGHTPIVSLYSVENRKISLYYRELNPDYSVALITAHFSLRLSYLVLMYRNIYEVALPHICSANQTEEVSVATQLLDITQK
jgi:hypothetical protein